VLSHTFTLPEAEWRGAQNRLALFEQLIEVRAEVVPVRYIDAEGFWKLVQASGSYQMRKQLRDLTNLTGKSHLVDRLHAWAGGKAHLLHPQ
jgi:uncharacterized Fe-S cluster-containing radical SAM superfamily protein